MITPILLICYNRPIHAMHVLDRVMEQKPKDLYIFQDAPRNCNNAQLVSLCDKVRMVVEQAVEGTETKLHYMQPEHNLGCGPGPMTAMNWFFEENEMGIILEDDAVPHPDFFGYCEELLERYKNDESVRAIGSMHLDRRSFGDGSYYFSMMNRTLCAWATWSRAWADFDLYHRDVTREQLNKILKDYYGCSLRMREYWCEKLAEVQKDAYYHTSWDMQFWISIWLHRGKGIMPNANLSTNIGFDGSGVHTWDSSSSGANRPTQGILPLVHPKDTRINREADARFQAIYFEPWNYGLQGLKRLPYRINCRLKRILGHEGSWIKR